LKKSLKDIHKVFVFVGSYCCKENYIIGLAWWNGGLDWEKVLGAGYFDEIFNSFAEANQWFRGL
jgi:hypothetical protein